MTCQRLTLLAASLVLAGLTGCAAVGPNYQRPALELPTTLGSAVPGAATITTTATDWLSWWKSFQDPVLDDLLKEAASANQDLVLAAGRIDEARANAAIADSNRYPAVDGNLGASRNRSSTTTGLLPAGAPQFSKDFQLRLSASYEIDFWGKFSRASEAARARLLAQEENRGAVLSSLYSNVAQNYFALRSYDAQRALADSALKTRQENLRLQQRRLTAGSIGTLELHQAESEVATAEIAQAQASQAVATTETVLAVLLGRSPRAITTPVIARGAPIDALYRQMIVPADLPADLLNRRPDILAAEQALVAANADIGQARANYFPSVRLTTGLGYESSRLSDLINPASLLWNLGMNLVQPIFRAGAIGAVVSGAEARKTQAEAQYVQSVQNAFKDVHDALTNLSASELVCAASTRRAAALTDALRLATLRYDNGYTSYLEVLTAQRDLLQTQSSLIDAQRNKLAAAAELYRAVGGGWEKPVGLAAK